MTKTKFQNFKSKAWYAKAQIVEFTNTDYLMRNLILLLLLLDLNTIIQYSLEGFAKVKAYGPITDIFGLSLTPLGITLEMLALATLTVITYREHRKCLELSKHRRETITKKYKDKLTT